MPRFCKVGSGGRTSPLEGPAGPRSLNACSPDVCLSLILLKESACFLTGLCWADEENGPPPPPASSDLPHPHWGFLYTIAQPLPFLWPWWGQGDGTSGCCSDTLHAAPLPFHLCSARKPLPSAPYLSADIFSNKGLETHSNSPTLLQFSYNSPSIVWTWWQQILDEMLFSELKVDVRLYAILSTLEQLAMSVQTLLAVLTLGTHQWSFYTEVAWFCDYSRTWISVVGSVIYTLKSLWSWFWGMDWEPLGCNIRFWST